MLTQRSDLLSASQWFCVQTLPKHEHIAAAHLRKLSETDVFNPRLRVWRRGRSGITIVSENVFPCYLFARFILCKMLDRVRYSVGVRDIVRFGCGWPIVPGQVIENLRETLSQLDNREEKGVLHPGQEVEIWNNWFQGAPAVVFKVSSSRQRVQVLLDMLGRTSKLELPLNEVLPHQRFPVELAAA